MIGDFRSAGTAAVQSTHSFQVPSGDLGFLGSDEPQIMNFSRAEATLESAESIVDDNVLLGLDAAAVAGRPQGPLLLHVILLGRV